MGTAPTQCCLDLIKWISRISFMFFLGFCFYLNLMIKCMSSAGWLIWPGLVFLVCIQFVRVTKLKIYWVISYGKSSYFKSSYFKSSYFKSSYCKISYCKSDKIEDLLSELSRNFQTSACRLKYWPLYHKQYMNLA